MNESSAQKCITANRFERIIHNRSPAAALAIRLRRLCTQSSTSRIRTIGLDRNRWDQPDRKNSEAIDAALKTGKPRLIEIPVTGVAGK
jgi:hypothetical protein